MLLWARCALSAARLAAGDVSGALHDAEEAAGSGVEADFHGAGQPGWCLGNALTAAGNPERGAAAMLESFGGESLSAVLPVERPAAAADLAEAQLARGDADAAEAVLRVGEAAAARAGSSWARAVTGHGPLRASSSPGGARPRPPPPRRVRPTRRWRPRGPGSPRAGRSRRRAIAVRRSRR